MKADLMLRRGVPSAIRFLVALAVILLAALSLGGCGPAAETSWSPDDKGIAYLDEGSLRIFDVATKQSRALDTGPGRVFSPSWSPDGKIIAFYSAVMGEHGSISVCVIDLASGRARTLAADVMTMPTEAAANPLDTQQAREEALKEKQGEAVGMAAYYGGIAWSPDGGRLACVAAHDDSGGSVLLVDCATGAASPIIEDTSWTGPIAWSPDGKRLAYVRQGKDEDGKESEASSLWVCELASGERHKLCDLPENVPEPGTRLEWSADSARIGFIMGDKHHQQQNRGIGCTVAAQPEAAVHDELLGITPIAAWSPGLTGVVFMEKREGDQWVLIYRGLRPRTRQVLGALPLESNDEDDWFSLPQFSHDGRKVALRVGKDPTPVNVEVFEIR